MALYAMTVFLHSGTQEVLDTFVFQRKYLPLSVGAAGSRHYRPSNLPILRFKAQLCDVTFEIDTVRNASIQKSVYTFMVVLFSILKGDEFYAKGRKNFCVRVLSV